MDSSAQPIRRIASNLLWTPGGIVRNPLLTLAPDGRVVAVESCSEPDRLAATEFYSGLARPRLPGRLPHGFRTPVPGLGDAAARTARADGDAGGVLVVISGLDYESLRLTSRSQIRRL